MRVGVAEQLLVVTLEAVRALLSDALHVRDATVVLGHTVHELVVGALERVELGALGVVERLEAVRLVHLLESFADLLLQIRELLLRAQGLEVRDLDDRAEDRERRDRREGVLAGDQRDRRDGERERCPDDDRRRWKLPHDAADQIERIHCSRLLLGVLAAPAAAGCVARWGMRDRTCAVASGYCGNVTGPNSSTIASVIVRSG